MKRCQIFFQIKPNGLGFSSGEPVDRKGSRVASSLQNHRDLVGAEHRLLEALVSSQEWLDEIGSILLPIALILIIIFVMSLEDIQA